MGINEFDALSKSYGPGFAILIVACLGLAHTVRVLYRENNLLHTRLEEVLQERGKALDALLSGAGVTKRDTPPVP